MKQTRLFRLSVVILKVAAVLCIFLILLKQQTYEKKVEYVSGQDKALQSEDQGISNHEIEKLKGFVNSLNMEFVLIPSGSFYMGSPKDEIGFRDEKPLHKVTISKPFFLQTTEVTQKQWIALMHDNPSVQKGDTIPVQGISWFEAREFIHRLNIREGTTKYRFITEAEWEYACRAGSQTPFFFGDDESKLREYAWYGVNSNAQFKPVGSQKPNQWGLYDIQGNVWEWCGDWYHESYYKHSNQLDPAGPISGKLKVLRGSAISNGLEITCRSAVRNYSNPSQKGIMFQGLRVAREK